MKLSEAIMMLGMTKRQGFGPDSLFSIDAPCAIGGALQMIGKSPVADGLSLWYSNFVREWPWAAIQTEALPNGLTDILGQRSERVVDCIWVLNDVHKWTRAQIAEWVATVEPKEEEQTPAEEQEPIAAICK